MLYIQNMTPILSNTGCVPGPLCKCFIVQAQVVQVPVCKRDSVQVWFVSALFDKGCLVQSHDVITLVAHIKALQLRDVCFGWQI